MFRVLMLLCTALAAMLASAAPAAAKEMPTVVWTRDVYGIEDAKIPKEWHLLTDEGRRKIVDAITEKLDEQTMSGKLPFKVAETTREFNAELVVTSPISIVPIVVTDAAFHAAYKAGNRVYHKYVMVTALDVAFCSAEDGGTLRLLGNLPLHFYTVLPESGDPAEMVELSEERKKELYAQFTVQMIRNHLDFSTQRKLFQNIEDKTEGSEETYQVADVKISSKKAQELFAGNNGAREAYVKKIIGDVFSSAYARRTGHVVYPSMTSGTWNDDAVKGTYSLHLNSPQSGESVMRMNPPDHPITLDVTGIGKKEVVGKKTSNVNGFMAYKVWLAKSPVEGKEEAEITNDTVEEFIKLESSAIEKSEHDIYRMLLIGAAQALGDQKI